MNDKVECQEAVRQSSEIVDVSSGRYSFHWTKMENLSQILTRGLYSAEFAQRIGDKEYKKKSGSSSRLVHLEPSPWYIWGGPYNIEKIGIIVGIPFRSNAPHQLFRIAPRQFKGVVLADKLHEEWDSGFVMSLPQYFSNSNELRSHVSSKVERLKRVLSDVN